MEKEELVINRIATLSSEVSGIKNAYSFGNNPDILSNTSQLPAILFWPFNFDAHQSGHHGTFTNELHIRGS